MPAHTSSSYKRFTFPELVGEHGNFVYCALLTVSDCHSNKYSTFQRNMLKFSEIKQFPWGHRTSKTISYKFVCCQMFSLPSAPHCLPVCGGTLGLHCHTHPLALQSSRLVGYMLGPLFSSCFNSTGTFNRNGLETHLVWSGIGKLESCQVRKGCSELSNSLK